MAKKRILVRQCRQCLSYFATKPGFEFHGLSQDELLGKKAVLEGKNLTVIVRALPRYPRSLVGAENERTICSDCSAFLAELPKSGPFKPRKKLAE
jgi:hypothetical protein